VPNPKPLKDRLKELTIRDAGQQETLVSGTNIKTVNSSSLLGSGNLDVIGGLATYKTVGSATGSHTAAQVAGTYGLGHGDPIAVSGTGTLYPLNIIYLQAADFPTVYSLTTKLRIKAQLYCNDVAPFTGTFIFGLHPVTRPGTSGGTGLVIYTIGAAVASSTVTFTNPAADSSNQGVSSDFAMPADGHYCIAVVTNQTMAADSHTHLSALLQMRNA
jgi:hypothetical protein